MSSANINDPAAIQALLDQLKSSDAWQKVANVDAESAATASSNSGNTPAAGATPPSRTADARANSSRGLHDDPQTPRFSREQLISEGSANAPSVAALLSRLQASGSFNAVAGSSRTSSAAPTYSTHNPTFSGGSNVPGVDAALPKSTQPPVPYTPRQDLRACTFQQALPHLARLSEDPDFVKTLTAMKTEQADLERQLWNERREIQRKHEDRVKAARTKASIIGAGLTQYEADALTDSFRTELLRFDQQRVLPAWDGLVTKQQAALEAFGVPAMFPSTEMSDRERQRQQKIMQVLGGLVGNEGSTPTRPPGARDG